MKIRHIFEDKDLISGRIVIRNSAGEPDQFTDFEFAATVAYKIGYIKQKENRDKKTFMSLTDGLTWLYTPEELLSRLNCDDVGFRPATRTEVVGIMRVVRNGFEK